MYITSPPFRKKIQLNIQLNTLQGSRKKLCCLISVKQISTNTKLVVAFEDQYIIESPDCILITLYRIQIS